MQTKPSNSRQHLGVPMRWIPRQPFKGNRLVSRTKGAHADVAVASHKVHHNVCFVVAALACMPMCYCWIESSAQHHWRFVWLRCALHLAWAPGRVDISPRAAQIGWRRWWRRWRRWRSRQPWKQFWYICNVIKVTPRCSCGLFKHDCPILPKHCSDRVMPNRP